MLADPALTEQERISEFRRILVAAFDLPTIARFVLGRYWRRATTEEAARVSSRLLEGLYRHHLCGPARPLSRGETLAVGHGPRRGATFWSRARSFPTRGPPVRVDWRVRGGPGSYKIIDVRGRRHKHGHHPALRLRLGDPALRRPGVGPAERAEKEGRASIARPDPARRSGSGAGRDRPPAPRAHDQRPAPISRFWSPRCCGPRPSRRARWAFSQ